MTVSWPTFVAAALGAKRVTCGFFAGLAMPPRRPPNGAQSVVERRSTRVPFTGFADDMVAHALRVLFRPSPGVEFDLLTFHNRCWVSSHNTEFHAQMADRLGHHVSPSVYTTVRIDRYSASPAFKNPAHTSTCEIIVNLSLVDFLLSEVPVTAFHTVMIESQQFLLDLSKRCSGAYLVARSGGPEEILAACVVALEMIRNIHHKDFVICPGL